MSKRLVPNLNLILVALCSMSTQSCFSHVKDNSMWIRHSCSTTTNATGPSITTNRNLCHHQLQPSSPISTIITNLNHHHQSQPPSWFLLEYVIVTDGKSTNCDNVHYYRKYAYMSHTEFASTLLLVFCRSSSSLSISRSLFPRFFSSAG